jgi:hypothetical protein
VEVSFFRAREGGAAVYTKPWAHSLGPTVQGIGE